jgi:hypothetical protein
VCKSARVSISRARLSWVYALFTLLASSYLRVGAVGAQELEPRLYTNVPTGMNFLVAGYVGSEGGVTFDPSVVLEDAKIEVDGPIVGYARSLALGDVSGKIDVGVAHVCLSGSAIYEGERLSRDVCGLADAKVRLSANFIGAPALSAQEFPGYRQDFVVGASLQLGVPIGQYDPTRLVNVGTNRASAKAEIGMAKVLDRWILELALAGTFYEDNDNFFGGRTREQDPIYSLQVHAVRSFAAGVWLAIDGTRYNGGQTITGGVVNDNRTSNGRLGVTVSIPLNRRQSLKLYFSRGVTTRTGTDFDTLGAAWQYRWGGGA